MTNFMWMFCEGFYLHKLIAAAFAEQKNLIMFYIIGWSEYKYKIFSFEITVLVSAKVINYSFKCGVHQIFMPHIYLLNTFKTVFEITYNYKREKYFIHKSC